jgi:hypothetical protein
MDFGPGWTITVTSDQAATKITKLNVYGFSPAKDEPVTAEPFTPLFSYGRAQ